MQIQSNIAVHNGHLVDKRIKLSDSADSISLPSNEPVQPVSNQVIRLQYPIRIMVTKLISVGISFGKTYEPNNRNNQQNPSAICYNDTPRNSKGGRFQLDILQINLDGVLVIVVKKSTNKLFSNIKY